jgi:hypothetical protein
VNAATRPEAGGNFIDTANVYTNGTSKRLLGELLADHPSTDERGLPSTLGGVINVGATSSGSNPSPPGGHSWAGDGDYDALIDLLLEARKDKIDLSW